MDWESILQSLPFCKQQIALKKFLSILSLSAETYTIIIHGYVLMSNHFHLLVETPQGIVAQSVLGSEKYIDETREKLTGKKDRERPSIGRVHKHRAKGELLEIISEVTGSTRKKILSRKGLVRQMAMDILYRFGGLTNPEIGKMMGLDYSTVSQGRKRFRNKARKDKNIFELVRKIEARCQG